MNDNLQKSDEKHAQTRKKKKTLTRIFKNGKTTI